MSGSVAGLGAGVTGLRAGDEVYGLGATTFLAAQVDDAATPRDFDVIIDTVGGQVLEASFGLVRRGGRLVTLGAPPSAERAAELGIHAMFFVVTPDATELTRLAELAEDGRLRPIVSQTFPVSEGRKAFESAALPHPPGKTVLIVRSDVTE
jgi:NADPH:quinone reductase-like Zn-dependent oxidoreductase